MFSSIGDVLRAYRKAHLLPGEVAQLELNVSATPDLATWSGSIDGEGGWRPVAGTFSALVGSSSRDIRLRHDFNVGA